MGATEFNAVWAAISQNPFPFVLAIIMVVGAVWTFVNYIYSSRVTNLNHRIDLRDDEVARLQKGLSSLSLPSPTRPDTARLDDVVLPIGEKIDNPLTALTVGNGKIDGKVFIPNGRIFDLVIKHREETAIEANAASKSFIGNWILVKSTVMNVRESIDYMTVTIDLENIEGAPKGFPLGIVSLYFSKDFDALKMLRKRDMVSAIGKLDKVDSHGFSLAECEFIVAEDGTR